MYYTKLQNMNNNIYNTTTNNNNNNNYNVYIGDKTWRHLTSSHAYMHGGPHCPPATYLRLSRQTTCTVVHTARQQPICVYLVKLHARWSPLPASNLLVFISSNYMPTATYLVKIDTLSSPNTSIYFLTTCISSLQSKSLPTDTYKDKKSGLLR